MLWKQCVHLFVCFICSLLFTKRRSTSRSRTKLCHSSRTARQIVCLYIHFPLVFVNWISWRGTSYYIRLIWKTKTQLFSVFFTLPGIVWFTEMFLQFCLMCLSVLSNTLIFRPAFFFVIAIKVLVRILAANLTNRCLAISNVRIYLSVWVGSRAKYSSRLQLVKYSKASVQSNIFSVITANKLKCMRRSWKKHLETRLLIFKHSRLEPTESIKITWLKTKTCDSKTLPSSSSKKSFKRPFSTVRGICQNLHYYVLKTMSDIRSKEEQ